MSPRDENSSNLSPVGDTSSTSSNSKSTPDRSESEWVTDLVVDLERLLALGESSGTGPFDASAPLKAEWMQGVLSHTDAVVHAPGRVELALTVFSASSVFAQGRLVGGFEVPCARCLEPAKVSANSELCVRFERATPAEVARASEDEEGEDGISVDPDEPDRFLFSGTKIDLRPMLSESIVLSYPIRALCERGEACRGLCTNCGADLNEQGQPEGSACTECGVGGAVGIGSPPEADAGGGENEPAWKAALRKLSEQ